LEVVEKEFGLNLEDYEGRVTLREIKLLMIKLDKNTVEEVKFVK
jgi:hypothetical protein